MSGMGLLTPRRTAPQPVVDVGAAQRFDRMGSLGRALTYLLAQERYAYMKGQHRAYKALGLDRAPVSPAKFDPFRGSHWMGRR